MQQVREIARTHWFAVLGTLLTILLYAAPHVAIPRLLPEGSPYVPSIVNLDERHFTTAKVNHVFYDRSVRGDPSVSEYPEAPFIMPPLPHWLMSRFAIVFGSVRAAQIAGDLVMPALSFALLYALGFAVTKRRIPAALYAALASILPRYLAFFPAATSYYRAYFISTLIKPQSRLALDRFEDPQFTLFLFAIALLALYALLEKRRYRYAALTGLSMGLLFYTYFYYAVYFAVAFGAVFLITLLRRDRELLKRFCFATGIAALVSAYYWVNLYRLASLPWYSDIPLRFGPEHTYAPLLYPRVLFAYAQHAGLVIAAWFLFKKNAIVKEYFVALLVPVFIVYNFQILTGFNPQPDHWIKPRQFILTLIFVALAHELLRRHYGAITPRRMAIAGGSAALLFAIRAVTTENVFVLAVSVGAILALAGTTAWYTYLYRRGTLDAARIFFGAGAATLVAFLFVKAVMTQYVFITDDGRGATLPPSEYASYAWIQENTPTGSVFGSTSFLTNTFIQNLTHAKIFAPNGLNTTISNKEILERFSFIARLYGVAPSAFESFFATEKTYPPKDYDHQGISYLFGDQYRARLPGSVFTNAGFGPPVWSAEEVAAATEPYRALAAEASVTIPYQLDYLYYGPREKVFGPDPGAVLPNLELAYDTEGIKIYRVIY